MSLIRILGIDPGFDRLGVSIIDKKGSLETLVHSECIMTSKNDAFEKRLVHIGTKLEDIIKEYKPHDLAIETLFFTTNQKTIITVSEVRGICIYLSHLHKMSIFEYSPPQIKLAIAGHGRATKQDVEMMVKKIIKQPIAVHTLDDEIDAIAIALTHSANRVHSLLKAKIA